MTALCCCHLAQRVRYGCRLSKDMLSCPSPLGALANWCLGRHVGQGRAWVGVVPSYLSGHQLALWGELSHSKAPDSAPFPSLAPRTGLGEETQTGQITEGFSL